MSALTSIATKIATSIAIDQAKKLLSGKKTSKDQEQNQGVSRFGEDIQELVRELQSGLHRSSFADDTKNDTLSPAEQLEADAIGISDAGVTGNTVESEDDNKGAPTVLPTKPTASPGELKNTSNLDKLKEIEASGSKETVFPDSAEAMADYWRAASGLNNSEGKSHTDDLNSLPDLEDLQSPIDAAKTVVSADEMADPRQDNTPAEELEEAQESVEQAAESGEQRDLSNANEEVSEAERSAQGSAQDPSRSFNYIGPNTRRINPFSWNVDRDRVYDAFMQRIKDISLRGKIGGGAAALLNAMGKMSSTNPMTGQASNNSVFNSIANSVDKNTLASKQHLSALASINFSKDEAKALQQEINELIALGVDPDRIADYITQLGRISNSRERAGVNALRRLGDPMSMPLSDRAVAV